MWFDSKRRLKEHAEPPPSPEPTGAPWQTETLPPEQPPRQQAEKPGRRQIGALFLAVCMLCSALSGAAGILAGFALYRHFGAEGKLLLFRPANNERELADGTIAAVVARVNDAVVVIESSNEEANLTNSASGVLVGQEDGYSYIVTNHHVVQGFVHRRVQLTTGEYYDAELVGSDWTTDLAVLRIEKTGLPSAHLASSAELILGESVVAIGNPLGGVGNSVTFGIVSALDCTIAINGIPSALFKTDAALNAGNSGGGVFNMDGELVGIVSAKISELDGSRVEGVGFAIPSDTVYLVAGELIERGFVSGRPELGLTFAPPDGLYAPLTIAGFAYPEELSQGQQLLPGDVIEAVGKTEYTLQDTRTGTGFGRTHNEARAVLHRVLHESAAGDTLYLKVRRSGSATYTLVRVVVHTTDQTAQRNSD